MEIQQNLSSQSSVSKTSSGEVHTGAHRMRVRKRDGSLVPVDVNKIVTRVTNCAGGLENVDPMRVATKAISGIYDGTTTVELDRLCIQTASMLTFEEPKYSKLAARLLAEFIDEEVATQGIAKFSHSVLAGSKMGLVADKLTAFVAAHARELDRAIDSSRTDLFEYFGLRTLYDRYLLKNPESRDVIENPQYFFMRVACGLSENLMEAVHFYKLISTLEYMPSSPTLFNSGTLRPQLSSCYLLDSPDDDLASIYGKYTDVALLSKFAGGIGLAYHRVRSRGSLIKGTNGKSNGIVPWLKTLDSSVAAVNQGGKRKGAACVYLETWHADIFEFLELRENTGDEAQRTFNLNLANWVPDLFMKRVEADGKWSLFDPKEVPHFTDTYGDDFESAYVEAENNGLYEKQVKARDLYARMMKTLAETGNGWMTFKDPSNSRCNQTALKGNVVHLSNLCTEILEVTSATETAVCNLGSINLARYVDHGKFDWEKLAKNVQTAVRYLDRVIDINFYPIDSAGSSNHKWRPVGLGLMGLQDTLFLMNLPFDSEEALKLSTRIQEVIYFNSLKTSCDLAEKNGPHPAYPETRVAQGQLQFDLWGVEPSNDIPWKELKARIKKHGLRNSLLIAVAPTATIASIVGSYESIEPQISNLFKRETLSGEFLQVNRYLVAELKKRGLWTEDIRTKLKMYEGSIQKIDEIPEDLKLIYRTVWEIPQKAMIDMAVGRGPYIDQSQSLNLFIESPNIGKLSSMYFYAWKQGVKTTYYLRSRPATRIKQITTQEPSSVSKKQVEDAEAVACSLENPETCDACQ
ncbi:MAG: ribonucleoside-diphosphate reductase subunit alpha [Deltaproteobacteria bacterium CG11_big_fil_rev_8_21_14_0_20_45_16]|nr:MAG: ribonucleoside-diphosphate reductase subunit alpha [Deltaproteobacteria bacterium CG11_big_fil_rev_8_21_14_0_20_45_16]